MNAATAFWSLFAVSAICGTICTFVAVLLSHKLQILDKPGGRKIHGKPIAYLGGFGFAMTMLIGVGIYAWLKPLEIVRDSSAPVAFVLGLAFVFLVGLWDDVVGIKAIPKLGLQILIGVFSWAAGLRIERLALGLGEPLQLLGTMDDGVVAYIISSLPSLAITVGWFVAIMNSINLIDGLDGLAGGIALLGSLSLGVVGLLTWNVGLNLGLALPAIAAGACLGFLVFNWHPASIFLGDSGSLSIGYTLAAAALLSSTKAPALLALLVPVVALGLPLFETIFSFARRAIAGGNPFKADKRHLHHRLLAVGLDQRRTVLIFHYATLYLGANAILLAREGSALVLVNVLLIGVGLVMLIEYLGFLEKKRESVEVENEENNSGEVAPELAGESS